LQRDCALIARYDKAGDIMKFFHWNQPKNTLRRHALGAVALLISSLSMSLGLLSSTMAQTTPYPNKSITMIVPFPPGGLADIVARPVAEAMGRELGQTVIIENKGGAGGGIGMGVAARSKPDGYTVLLALSSLTVIPEADALLGRSPMFLLNELRPLLAIPPTPLYWQCVPMRLGRLSKNLSKMHANVLAPSITALPATTAPCMCPWKFWRKPLASK